MAGHAGQTYRPLPELNLQRVFSHCSGHLHNSVTLPMSCIFGSEPFRSFLVRAGRLVPRMCPR